MPFELLDESRLLHEVLPEIEKMKGVEQPPQYHPEGDVWIHTLMLLEQLPAGVSRTLAWGSLLHDVGKPPTFRRAPDRIRFDGHVEVGVAMAKEICHRLRMSNDDTEQILALVDNHMRFADTPTNEGVHAEAFHAPAAVRRTPGAASPRLPEQPRRSVTLRYGFAQAAGDSRTGNSAHSTH